METEVFEMEQKPLFYSGEHSTYLQDPPLKRLRHSKVVKQSICRLRRGLPFSSILARVFLREARRYIIDASQ